MVAIEPLNGIMDLSKYYTKINLKLHLNLHNILVSHKTNQAQPKSNSAVRFLGVFIYKPEKRSQYIYLLSMS